MIRSAVLSMAMLVAVFASLGASAAADNDALFEKALQAARNSDWSTLTETEQQLPKDYPLRAYLDFHRLRAALPDLSPQRIRAFAQRYPDSPLPNDIRQLALVAYAKAQRWKDARSLFDAAPRAISLKCYYLQARLPVARKAVLQEARQLWLSGQSQPSSCDPLFDAARQDGIIGEDEIWQRMQLAFRARQPSLMRYLQPMLDSHKTASQWLLKLYASPQAVDELPKDLSHVQRQTLIALAFRRLAYIDTVEARERFENSRKTLGFTDAALRKQAATRIAWYSIIRDIDDNRQWQDQWLADSDNQKLLDQRARLAVTEQDWKTLPRWVGKLSTAEQRDSRWLYWQGRAATENGQQAEARKYWSKAAQQRNFYGFLAADKLGQGYHFNNQAPADNLPTVKAAAITRVTLLRRIDEPRLAWGEWNWLLWRSNESQARALAQLALERGWNDLAVQASIHARAWNILAWRFPPAYQAQFASAGRQYGVDPWLAMAVARRESAFRPEARSSAGALGLMQLMPGTARKVSRQAGQQPPSREQLGKPATSIDLGTQYLAELLERFDGNRVLALAAYNAGPNRVERWLADDQDEAVPADVWIASIPFHETRDYVQAVLAYRVLFIGLHGPQRQVARLLSHREESEPYSSALINDDIKLPTE